MAGCGYTIKEMLFSGGACYEMEAIFYPCHFHYLGGGK
jgi:hypothetical protein